jgi:hypothetical protein
VQRSHRWGHGLGLAHQEGAFWWRMISNRGGSMRQIFIPFRKDVGNPPADLQGCTGPLFEVSQSITESHGAYVHIPLQRIESEGR